MTLTELLANEELRTYNPPVDRIRSIVQEVQRVPEESYGCSGERWVIEPDLLLEGFFPPVKLTDRPARRPASGFREIGLPFESDAAITKHLAAFLTSNAPRAPREGRPLTGILSSWSARRAGKFSSVSLTTDYIVAIAAV